jgi:hypothetical protein
LADRRFEEAVKQYNAHFSQAGAATYFLLARDNYYELKRMANRNIGTQVLQHRKVAATNFSDLPANIGQKRELLEKRIATLQNIDRSYSNTSDVYQTVSTLETEALARLSLDDLPLDDMDLLPLKPMLEANANVTLLIQHFKNLANDEVDRLLIKLDEFPAPAAPCARKKPSKGKKKKPRPAPSKPTQPAVQAPKNRLEIVTEAGDALTGKPRDDNPNVVDILDSRVNAKPLISAPATGTTGPNTLRYSPPCQPVARLPPPIGPAIGNICKVCWMRSTMASRLQNIWVRKKALRPPRPKGCLSTTPTEWRKPLRSFRLYNPDLQRARSASKPLQRWMN